MEKESSNNGIITFLASSICLVNGIRIYLNSNMDKIGIKILYGQIGFIFVLWVLAAAAFVFFFTKKMWKSKQKVISILFLIIAASLSLLQISTFADCCTDLANGTKSIVTNEYPVVWDKIYISSNSDEYAYVSDDIAKQLNENKVLTVTSDLDIERDNNIEVVYYPKTHILIRAEVVK